MWGGREGEGEGEGDTTSLASFSCGPESRASRAHARRCTGAQSSCARSAAIAAGIARARATAECAMASAEHVAHNAPHACQV